MTWKRWSTVAVLTASLLFLPGCWDYEAIQTRAALLGLAVDPVPNNDKELNVTLQFPVLSSPSSGGNAGGSSAGPSGSQSFENHTQSGYTIFEAMKKIQLATDRNLDPSQIRAVVVSDQLSPSQMSRVFSELMRQAKFNALAYFAVTPQDAAQILDFSTEGQAPADALDKKFRQGFRQHGYYLRKQTWEFWRDSLQPGIAPVAPIVQVEQRRQGEEDSQGQAEGPGSDENQGEGEGAGSSGQGGGQEQSELIVRGAEAFRRDGPTFKLGDEDTLMVNLMQGTIRNMVLNLPLPGTVVPLTDVRSKGHITVRGEGNHLTLVDHVVVHVTVGQSPSGSYRPDRQTDLMKLKRDANGYFTQEANRTLATLQQHQADVLGFGMRYLQNHPDQQQLVEAKWPQMFAHAKRDIVVDVRISTRGSLI